MVCPRCISAVKAILIKLDIPFGAIRLGEIEVTVPLTDHKKQQLSAELEAIGFALIQDRNAQLIEQMKKLVIEEIHYSKSLENLKWPDHITNRLKLDYKYLSSLFSSVESITFEQFIINQKIEKVKELLIYDELSLKEIAFLLHYSSVAYLSNQFRKITGMSPTEFKQNVHRNRKSLDEL